MDESHFTAVAEPPVDTSLLEKLLNNRLSEKEARQFATESPEYITFTLLALQQRLAGATQTIGPNTPSSVIPPYQKPPIKPKPNKEGKKKRGGQPGPPDALASHCQSRIALENISASVVPNATANSHAPARRDLDAAKIFPKTSSRSSPKM